MKLDKKVIYGIGAACAVLVIVLLMVVLPSGKKDKTTQRMTLVVQDQRLKCDIVEDAKLGGEDRTETFTLTVDSQETVLDYVISESYSVAKVLSIENPKADDMMPQAPSLALTDRYYVMVMVGDILKVETLDKDGIVIEEKYQICNARSEYTVIPVSLLSEYDSVHLEHRYVNDVKIMPRGEFMTKIKDVNEVYSLTNW